MPRTLQGSRRSSLNRLKYGCELDFLPCKRSDCVFADECRNDPYIKRDGFPPDGTDCIREVREHEAFVATATYLFPLASEWLDDLEFNRIVQRLSILRIRWARISARITVEGGIVRTEFPNGTVILREHVAFRRYWATTQREWSLLLDQLLYPSSESERG